MVNRPRLFSFVLGLVFLGFGCVRGGAFTLEVPPVVKAGGFPHLVVRVENATEAEIRGVSVMLPETYTRGLGNYEMTPMPSRSRYDARKERFYFEFDELVVPAGGATTIDMQLRAKGPGVYRGKGEFCLGDACESHRLKTAVLEEYPGDGTGA